LLYLANSKYCIMKTKNRIWFCHLILIGLVLVFATDCKKQEPEPAKLAVLSTVPVTDITITTAVSGGNITSDGGAEIIAYGVCWSTAFNPSLTDAKTVDGVGTAHFVSSLSGLTAGTSYHVRAYATNSVGTAYGVDWPFITYKSDAITDNDGNYCNIVTIGTQVWMAENLKTTRYRNGDLIGTTTPVTLDISAEATPKYQWAPKGDESNVAIYGRYYTWYTVTDTRNVCPTGWHVPGDAEWNTMINFLGADNAGGKLKETGTTHWQTPNAGATNETGFTAIASGFRESHGGGGATQIATTSGHWWSVTEDAVGDAHDRYVTYDLGGVYRGYWTKHDGPCVRCLRDN
jgi:uncharacterized protein (TIGR02145 family)